MTTNALETFPIVNQLDGRFAQAAPSRKPLATELESTEVDECSRFRGFLQRICNTFSHRLSIQASFPRIHRSRRRTLQAHMHRILHFDHSGLCEPAADAFVSCQPRRAGSSCHSSRYSARYRSRGIGPEPLPVGTITRGPFAGCRSLRRGAPS